MPGDRGTRKQSSSTATVTRAATIATLSGGTRRAGRRALIAAQCTFDRPLPRPSSSGAAMSTASDGRSAIPGRICVLLPVLNEAENIDRLWAGIAGALQDRPYVVCFVDDGSRDGTVARILQFAEAHPRRVHLIQR